ncbi:MAG: hypothetical protein WKF78_12170 [Candidatus Limnocylindrales bacterium]
MDEDVSGPDRGEHVGRLVFVRGQQARGRDRRPWRRTQVRPVQVRDAPEGGQVKHARHVVHVVGFQTEAAHQQVAGDRRHRTLDLQAHRLTEIGVAGAPPRWP